jgi:hypothetical protein
VPEISETQPARNAEVPNVDVAVIQSMENPRMTQILKGAYGRYEDGRFYIDPAIRAADPRMLADEYVLLEPRHVAVLPVRPDLAHLLKAHLASALGLRWNSMYSSLSSQFEPQDPMSALIAAEKLLAREAVERIKEETGCNQQFAVPLSATGLRVQWRMALPSYRETDDADPEDGEDQSVDAHREAEWGVNEHPYAYLHTGVQLAVAGEVEPVRAEEEYGTVVARLPRNPRDVSENLADGQVVMRVQAHSAAGAVAFAQLLAENQVVRAFLLETMPSEMLLLREAGEPYAPHHERTETVADVDSQRTLEGQASAGAGDEGTAEPAAEPPIDDLGFFDAPPPVETPPAPRERPHGLG